MRPRSRFLPARSSFFCPPSSARSGQALVESIIALTVLTVGFLGIFSLLSQSFGLNRVVSDNYVGTYLAAEGIEVVKNIIDANQIAGRDWLTGLPDGTFELEYSDNALQSNQNRFLAFDSASRLYSYRGSLPTPFRRAVTLTRLGGGEELRVVSRVFWTTRGSGEFEISLEDHFYRWRR